MFDPTAPAYCRYWQPWPDPDGPPLIEPPPCAICGSHDEVALFSMGSSRRHLSEVSLQLCAPCHDQSQADPEHLIRALLDL